MPNEVDDFLKEVGEEAKPDPFVKNDSDPLGSTTKSDVRAEDKTDDKPLPFHKDPKVQRYIEKEIGKRIKDIRPSEVQQFAKDVGVTEDELTETLIEIIGNDTPQKASAVKKFRAQLENLKKAGAEQALSEIRQQSEAEQAEQVEAEEELRSAFDNIEEEFDVDLTSNTTVARKERSDFIDFIKRVSPKDSNGDVTQYPDFQETWKLFQSTKKPVADNKRAKDISSRSMERSSDASTPPKGNTWKDVDRLFQKL